MEDEIPPVKADVEGGPHLSTKEEVDLSLTRHIYFFSLLMSLGKDIQ
jgi:hypothetical protein